MRFLEGVRSALEALGGLGGTFFTILVWGKSGEGRGLSGESSGKLGRRAAALLLNTQPDLKVCRRRVRWVSYPGSRERFVTNQVTYTFDRWQWKPSPCHCGGGI